MWVEVLAIAPGCAYLTRGCPQPAGQIVTVFPSALLTDRGVVAVSGPDAEKLLQGLITNDVVGLQEGEAIFAGLLAPQGKVLFDFLLVRTGDGYLLDVAGDKAADLVKRLTLYRLRSKVDIVDRSAGLVVIAAWGDLAIDAASPSGIVGYSDPRLAELGRREFAKSAETPLHSGQSASEAAYHAHRIARGVPEGGRDYAYGDAFPHEALLDQLNGVSFSKGCYVGQEIVSRMQHRGTARKRIVQVMGDHPLPTTGADVVAGDIVIGTLGSASDREGLALVRLDRAAEFKAKGVALSAGGVRLELRKPAFATFELEPKPVATVSPT